MKKKSGMAKKKEAKVGHMYNESREHKMHESMGMKKAMKMKKKKGKY